MHVRNRFTCDECTLKILSLQLSDYVMQHKKYEVKTINVKVSIAILKHLN